MAFHCSFRASISVQMYHLVPVMKSLNSLSKGSEGGSFLAFKKPLLISEAAHHILKYSSQANA